MWFIIFSIVLPIVFYYYYQLSIVVGKNGKLKGPITLPIVGNTLTVLGTSFEFFKTVEGFFIKYGSRFRFYVAHHLLILLSDPKDCEVILSSQQFIEKSTDYDFFLPWLGTGLLTSTGTKWRRQRKILTPAFHFKILEHFIQVFDRQTDVLLEKLSKKADGRVVDIFPDITLCTLDIICEAAMGVSVNAQNDEESEYVKAVKTMCKIINGRQRNIIKRWDQTFILTSDFWKQRKALKILHSFTNNMIRTRKEKLMQENVDMDSYTAEETGIKKKLAFLDLLLLTKVDGKPLPDSSIREEVDTFLFEGHDTTSSGVSFLLYELSKHPEVQERLYQEQMEIMHDRTQSASYVDLQNMKLLDLAIKEGVRLFPPVPMIARKIKEQTQINDMLIPADTTVIIHVYHLHRNPAIFDDPDKFILERQLPEECNKRNPFSQVAFSAGPRNCIGQKFAMLEMKSTLSKIIRNFKFEPSHEEVQLTIDVILKSVNGIKIKLLKRE